MASRSETAAGRVPSRTVSVATRRSAETGAVPRLYHGRLDDRSRQLVVEQGGSDATEAAVESALAWLARAQDHRDGHWDTQAWEGGHDSRDFATFAGVNGGVQANSATTGLALLAFLAAGHTHRHGEYQQQVAHGLEFLRHSQSPTTGSLAGDAGRYVAMYCHGIATLAMSEAYIMTRDESLRPVLERAVHYTVVTQHPRTGGWRYQPGDQGDTSQFGWQVMALVSARSAGIAIPARVWQGADRWLQRVSLGDHGGLACYTPDRRVPSHSMTAEALACRFFLQTVPSRATVNEAANFISREGLGRGPHEPVLLLLRDPCAVPGAGSPLACLEPSVVREVAGVTTWLGFPGWQLGPQHGLGPHRRSGLQHRLWLVCVWKLTTATCRFWIAGPRLGPTAARSSLQR